MADVWDPAQYARFQRERSHAFFDLAGFVQWRPAMRVVDLGCGTGELTRVLHERLAARETLGLDSSPAMLARAQAHAGGGLRFAPGDIAAWEGTGYDLVFSNAALHWVPEHEALLTRLRAALAPGGQLAVQLPANHEHPSQLVAHQHRDATHQHSDGHRNAGACASCRGTVDRCSQSARGHRPWR